MRSIFTTTFLVIVALLCALPAGAESLPPLSQQPTLTGVLRFGGVVDKLGLGRFSDMKAAVEAKLRLQNAIGPVSLNAGATYFFTDDCAWQRRAEAIFGADLALGADVSLFGEYRKRYLHNGDAWSWAGVEFKL